MSDKVIDRANTIEFFEVDLSKLSEPHSLPVQLAVSYASWKTYVNSQPDISFRPKIIEFNKILNKAQLGLGFRTLRDIELYLANSKGLLEPNLAFDLQVKQRILPRVRGSDSEEFRNLFTNLIEFTIGNNLKNSEQRAREMEQRLKRDGYTSFWR